MPNFDANIRKLGAAAAAALAQRIGKVRSLPGLAVAFPPVDSALAQETDTAESLDTAPPAVTRTESVIPTRLMPEGVAGSDICQVVKDRIQRNVSDLVHRNCPNPLMPYVPFRGASLSGWFETELFTNLERGGRDLVRCEVEVAGQRSGGGLSYVEIETISDSTFKWLEKF
jgi:hypothetical protein